MCKIEPKVTSVYPPHNPHEISHERIALRAFSKWLARGCPEGSSETDWYAALSELEREDQSGTPSRQMRKTKPDGVRTLPTNVAGLLAAYGMLI
ncbi:MAG TPA: DUF2934 domain-containing protein [Polyangiaceae bacterium]|nr:DUF2934 domain-containing protein [Polyangiaceae bacterium]